MKASNLVAFSLRKAAAGVTHRRRPPVPSLEICKGVEKFGLHIFWPDNTFIFKVLTLLSHYS